MRSSLALQLLVLFVPGALAATVTENFEEDTVGTSPVGAYNYAPAGPVAVSNTAPVLGSKALRLGPSSTGTFGYAEVCGPASSGGAASFSFNLDALPTGGELVVFQFENSVESGKKVRIKIDSLGVATGEATGWLKGTPGTDASNVFSPVTIPITVAPDTWYAASIQVTGFTFSGVTSTATCAKENDNAVGRVEFTVGTGFAAAQGSSVYLCMGTATPNACGAPAPLDVVKFTNPPSVPYLVIDNATFLDNPAAPTVGSYATATVTNLVGADVHESGSGIVVRTDGGDFIRAYQPTGSGSLASAGTPSEVDCNRNDGLSVSDVAAVWLRCDGGNPSAPPITMQIRALNLGVFDFPGDCDPSDDCLDDIDLTAGSRCSNWPDDLEVRELKDFKVVPLDYSYITAEGGLVDDDRAVAVAYSTTTGYVGVVEFTTRTGADECHWQRQPFSATEPTQVAVWQPSESDDTTLIVAAKDNGQTKVYEYVPRVPAGGTSLEGEMTTGRTLGVSNANAVSCAKLLCLIQTTAISNNLHLIHVETSAQQAGFPKTVANPQVRGVFLDSSAEFFGYMDGAEFNAGHVDTGTVFGRLSAPSGTFREVRAQTGFVNFWIFTSTTIAYYNGVDAFPNDIEPVCSFNCGDGPPTTAPSGGILRIDGQSYAAVLGNNLGIGEFGGSLLLSGSTIFGMALTGAATLGAIAGYRSIALILIGAGIGFIVGFLSAWGLGFLTTGAVFTVVILSVLLIVAGIFVGRR